MQCLTRTGLDWRVDKMPLAKRTRVTASRRGSSSRTGADRQKPGRSCPGVGDAHGLGDTSRPLLALDLDGPLVRHADAAVGHVVGSEQLLPAADAPVRAGPDMSGRVYVWTGSTWELSRNDVTIPEGFYIWDAGDKAPTNAVKGK